MKLKKLKYKYPEMPQDIRDMIENEVMSQTNSDKVSKSNKIKWKKFLIISIAATMVLGTTVFASTKIHEWYVEKEGKYGLKTEIIDESSKYDNMTLDDIPDEIPVLSFEPGYLPDGLEKAYGNSYFNKKTPYQGGIMISSPVLTKDNIANMHKNVVYNQKISINGKEAIYLENSYISKKNGSNEIDKRIYIAYPEYYRIVDITIGPDISRKEAIKFAENLKIKKTNQLESLSAQKFMNQYDFETYVPKITATKEEMKNLHKIGDTLKRGKLETKVTNVQISDDLSLLNQKLLCKDLLDIVDDNGKIKQNSINYVKSGDGINSLDKIIDTKQVNQKLVYITVDYTNTGKTPINDLIYFGYILKLDETEDGYQIYDRAKVDGNKDTDYVTYSSLGGQNYKIDDGFNEEGKNHTKSIEPGDTITIHFVTIVNEDELDKMYFSTDQYGAETEFGAHALSIGYYDIRQK